MTYFEEIRRRIPHFFKDISVLEYVPHDRCKSIGYLFDTSRYIVLNPETNDLSNVQMDSFRVAMSVDRFHLTPNYIKELEAMHKVASKFVMFSCAAAGTRPTHDGYWKNLTEADFYGSLNIDKMFETHKFFADYETHSLYFWGVKK